MPKVPRRPDTFANSRSLLAAWWLLLLLPMLVACSASATATLIPSTATPFPSTDTPSPTTPTRLKAFSSAEVTRVVDGDTIDAMVEGSVQRVRLIGISAPEAVPGRPVGCYGPEASAKARELLDGRTIDLQRDPTQDDKDIFGRLLRHVWMDGANVALTLIEEGYAEEHTYSDPYMGWEDFNEAEGRAKAEGLGLWSACSDEVPGISIPFDPLGSDRDCEDFDVWREAQDFYEAAGGPGEDRHRLDSDRDGIACEGLK